MPSIFTGMGNVLNELARTTVIDLTKAGKMPKRERAREPKPPHPFGETL